jgi:hypothetical protein
MTFGKDVVAKDMSPRIYIPSLSVVSMVGVVDHTLAAHTPYGNVPNGYMIVDPLK